ncbi:restriction endonuclease subunit S [Vibrio cholerae]|nr:restriction endonuclease subunit S [Vibrio cholerae]EHD2281219.1 restriction endonuclease subunit S [Vibrio cholerae]EJL6487810.1 restriction endonuclease subunit S [Vibrio cholerae]EJL6585911.1 restriction endonuclease subunit S [Vibrio cholerae]EJL6890320.1 restriction endonuclease subunit S [Vibrio cholerae]
MASEWESYTIEELASSEKSALATGPFGSAISAKFFVDAGFPVIRGSNLSTLTSERMNDEGLVFVSDEKAAEFKRSVVRKGDLIFTCWGTINQVGLIDSRCRYPEYIISNKQMKVTLDTSKADPLFVYYYFSSPAKQREILQNGIGAAVPGFNLGQLRSHTLRLPPLSLQKKISSFIDALDSKITLNRQINQTLEQMAQALFKSWFVDFDPVMDNALDAGNPIPDELQHRAEARQAVRESEGFKPLPDDVRQLFPDAFEESELGWVPKGWGSKNLTMLVDTISKTYPLKTVDKVIFLNTGDIEDGRFLHADFSKVAGLPGQAKKSIQCNDILFSEIRPKNKRFAYVNFEAEHHVVSTKLMVLRAKQDVHPLFAYFLLTLEKTTNELQRIAELRSGTFPQITYTELGLISFSLPNDTKLIDAFVGLYLQPFYEKSFKSRDENGTLTKLRDTLLPKLISGELRLDEVELAVEQEAVSAEQQNER